ncbi:MAG: aspartate-semialdehyde dehydrogenase [Psychromonas sp.]|nr:aspartate-semialdehyde dehydrogenase [Psychromonas sp.]
MKTQYNIALYGDLTGPIEAILALLGSRQFPVEKLFALCDGETETSSIMFVGKPVSVIDIAGFDWHQVDIAFFMTSIENTQKWSDIASEHCIVIDNSGAFTSNKQIPLVQIGINDENIASYTNENKIALPSAGSAQLAAVLKQLHKEVGIVRINVASYQAVSACAREGVKTLADETERLLNLRPLKESIFPQQIAFNIFPEVDDFDNEGNALSETRLINEVRDLLQDPSILVTSTQVIVPMFYGCAQAVHLQTHYPVELDEVVQAIHHTDGIELEESVCDYPNMITDVVGNDIVRIGRLRKDVCETSGINLWICADNLQFGIANNVIRVAEKLIRDYI